jgi:hypothetical protein
MNIKNLDVNPKSGTGTASLAVTASPNLATIDKENTIKFYDQYGKIYRVKVTQKAKEEFIKVDESRYVFPSEGGDIVVTGSGNIAINNISHLNNTKFILSDNGYTIKEFKWVNDVTEEEHTITSIDDFDEEHPEYGYTFSLTISVEAKTDGGVYGNNLAIGYSEGYTWKKVAAINVEQRSLSIESITEEVSLESDDTESTIEINTYNENGKWSFAGIE